MPARAPAPVDRNPFASIASRLKSRNQRSRFGPLQTWMCRGWRRRFAQCGGPARSGSSWRSVRHDGNGSGIRGVMQATCCRARRSALATEPPSGPEPACVATDLYCSIHLLLDFVLPKATDLRRALDERAARFPDAWLVSSSVALASHPSTTLPRPGRLAASQRGAPCAFAEGLDAS